MDFSVIVEIIIDRRGYIFQRINTDQLNPPTKTKTKQFLKKTKQEIETEVR